MFLNIRLLISVLRAAVIASMLMMAAPVCAQNPATPNLSGNWQLVEFDGNKDTSNPKFPKMTLVIEQESFQLKITEKRIKQGQEEIRRFVYNADGSGDTNAGRVELWRTKSRFYPVRGPQVDNPQYETVTRTDKRRIFTEYKRELRMLTGGAASNDAYASVNTESSRKDEWNLNAAGNKLTLTIRSMDMHEPMTVGGNMPGSSSAMTSRTEWNTSKLVFRKVS